VCSLQRSGRSPRRRGSPSVHVGRAAPDADRAFASRAPARHGAFTATPQPGRHASRDRDRVLPPAGQRRQHHGAAGRRPADRHGAPGDGRRAGSRAGRLPRRPGGPGASRAPPAVPVLPPGPARSGRGARAGALRAGRRPPRLAGGAGRVGSPGGASARAADGRRLPDRPQRVRAPVPRAGRRRAGRLGGRAAPSRRPHPRAVRGLPQPARGAGRRGPAPVGTRGRPRPVRPAVPQHRGARQLGEDLASRRRAGRRGLRRPAGPGEGGTAAAGGGPRAGNPARRRRRRTRARLARGPPARRQVHRDAVRPGAGPGVRVARRVRAHRHHRDVLPDGAGGAGQRRTRRGPGQRRPARPRHPRGVRPALRRRRPPGPAAGGRHRRGRRGAAGRVAVQGRTWAEAVDRLVVQHYGPVAGIDVAGAGRSAA
jgi:hypothetical protein